MIGIKVSVTMSRTLYVDLPEDSTEAEILKKAGEDIILPHNALQMASNALQRVNMRVDKLDLNDWEVDDCKTEIIK